MIVFKSFLFFSEGSIWVHNVSGVKPLVSHIVVISAVESISHITVDLGSINVIEVPVSSKVGVMPISKIKL